MVAHRGRNWQLAPSLIALEAEVNRLAPNRNKASDGSIGDAAHSARTSDHNPDNGWVDAIDITHDPANGMDIHGLLRQLAARGDARRRVKYLISNGQIHNPSRGDPPGRWRRYTGSNQHTRHGHISILNSGRVDTSPWWPPVTLPAPPVSDEEEEVTVLIRNNESGHPTYGAVFAINGFLRQPVTSDDYPVWQFLTGGPAAVRQLDAKAFDFFIRNTREVASL